MAVPWLSKFLILHCSVIVVASPSLILWQSLPTVEHPSSALKFLPCQWHWRIGQKSNETTNTVVEFNIATFFLIMHLFTVSLSLSPLWNYNWCRQQLCQYQLFDTGIDHAAGKAVCVVISVNITILTLLSPSAITTATPRCLDKEVAIRVIIFAWKTLAFMQILRRCWYHPQNTDLGVSTVTMEIVSQLSNWHW